MNEKIEPLTTAIFESAVNVMALLTVVVFIAPPMNTPPLRVIAFEKDVLNGSIKAPLVSTLNKLELATAVTS